METGFVFFDAYETQMGMEPVVLYLALLSIAGGCQFGSLPECVYQCHCENGNPCDPVTGACPDGCDDGDPDGYLWRGAWGGPGCQEGNVAYMQPATGSLQQNIGPGRAVDGDRDPAYSFNSGSCSFQEASSWRLLMWRVDLGRSHVVNQVTVYGTDVEHSYRRNYWLDRKVEVGELADAFQRCGSLGENDQALKVQVMCPGPLVGRYVRIIASGPHYQTPRLFLCEVYVNGYRFVECTGGTFGPGCLTACHCRTHCNVISGECSSRCEDGWRGSNCQNPCGAGTWGPNCSHTCHCMNQSEACHHIDGSCKVSGCAPSHVGVGCDAVIPSLNSAPYNLTLINTTRLEFEFRSWQPSQDSGDRPSSYVPQLRMLPGTTWKDMPEIPAGSGAISVRLDYDFVVNATYDVRVTPLLVHEGVVHRGTGEHATLDILPNGSGPMTMVTGGSPPASTPSGAIAGGLVAVLLIVVLVVLAVFLRRRRQHNRNVSPAENGTSVTASLSDPPRTAGAADGLTTEINNPFVNVTDTSNGIGTHLPHIDHSGGAGHAKDQTKKTDESLYRNQVPLELPLKIEELGAHIQDTKSQPGGFQTEFMQIPKGQIAKCDTGALTLNRGKNRFNNVMAYDHSRVKLDVSKHDQGQGYINANFIPSFENRENGYIASQGPRVHTIIDTWQMVWQYQVNRIVMLTNIMEDYKAKCEYYWPEQEGPLTKEYGKFKVKLDKTEQFADYVVRTLSVSHKEETRSVTQFHYLSWPDHDAPLSTVALLGFRRKIRALDDTATGPLVVHCSAGVGRTGAFIAVDYLLDQAMSEKQVDVLNYVSLMRNHRINMVQNVAQYTFVYEALLHALQLDSTAIPSADMARVFPDLLIPNPETNQSPLARQFELLDKTPISDTSMDGLKPDNIDKNRNISIIPHDNNRPFLFPRKDAGNNYINAAFINGYRRLSAYIVTQIPLPQTLCDFWRMVYDHKSTSIVLTHDFNQSQLEDETCPQYWPSDVNGVLDLDFLEVVMESEETFTDCIIVRQFKITDIQETGRERIVRQFHLQGWLDTATTPPNPDHLLALLDALEQWQRKSGDGVVTVQCKNGVHQSGVVCAVSFLLEKLKVDQEIDAFLAVAQIRLGRHQLIDSFEQYVFLHEIAMKYMEGYDMYANFKVVA